MASNPFQDRIVLIGERLREARLARGYSMSIAQTIRDRYKVRIDQSYLSRIERGKAEPPLRTLMALADFLGIDASHLMRRDEDLDGASRLLTTSVIGTQINILLELLDEKTLLRAMEGFLNTLWQIRNRSTEDADKAIGVASGKDKKRGGLF